MRNLEELEKKYHWFKLAEDGAIELYLDHHSMSIFRACEAHFELGILNGIKPKGNHWFLDFGVVFHKMVEEFYTRKLEEQATQIPFNIEAWLTSGIALWRKYDLDKFREHKGFKNLAGMEGFVALLAQYQQHYQYELTRLRPIALEVPFGKGKEVLLGAFDKDGLKIRCYLTGRIDFLMDDGKHIGPLDHKTTASFHMSKDVGDNYVIQEGMTGYLFAVKSLLGNNFPHLLETRTCDRIWMNYVQVQREEDFTKRFKRVPIFKTDFQLEEYRKRQLRTMEKIFDLVAAEKTADWNTSVCNNWFHQPCPYHSIHRQNSPESMLVIINANFKQEPPWNPEEMED